MEKLLLTIVGVLGIAGIAYAVSAYTSKESSYKVPICHARPGNYHEMRHTIYVDESEVEAHRLHGDPINCTCSTKYKVSR